MAAVQKNRWFRYAGVSLTMPKKTSPFIWLAFLGMVLGVSLFFGAPLFLEPYFLTRGEKIEDRGLPETTSHAPPARSPEKNQGPERAEKISSYLRQMAIQPFKQSLEAPDFALPGLINEEIRLSHFRGSLVLLNFWATWCGPCRMEMPAMEKLYREFKDQNFVILAISIDRDEARAVAHFADSFHLSFPILLDPEGITSSMYAVTSIPTTYLVDPEGILIGGARGSRAWDQDSARNLIRTLLDRPGRTKS